jgi:hypothetical protein
MKYIYEKIIQYSSINLIYVSSICMIHIKNIKNNKDVVSSK